MKKKMLLVPCFVMAMALTACAGKTTGKPNDSKPSQGASGQPGSEQANPEKETQKTLDRVMKYVASDGKILEIRYVTVGGEIESIKQYNSEGKLEVNYGCTVQGMNNSVTYIVGKDEVHNPIEQEISYTYWIGGDQYQDGGGPRGIYLKINDASAVLTLAFEKKDGNYEIYAKEYFLQN